MFQFAVYWVGLGQSVDGLGRVMQGRLQAYPVTQIAYQKSQGGDKIRRTGGTNLVV